MRLSTSAADMPSGCKESRPSTTKSRTVRSSAPEEHCLAAPGEWSGALDTHSRIGQAGRVPPNEDTTRVDPRPQGAGEPLRPVEPIWPESPKSDLAVQLLAGFAVERELARGCVSSPRSSDRWPLLSGSDNAALVRFSREAALLKTSEQDSDAPTPSAHEASGGGKACQGACRRR